MNRRTSLVTTTRARSLRRDMTIAERMLWRALRDKQINGHRFRRQHPIGKYIADFACIEQKIVIELDGGQHQDRVAYDEQRTAYLQENGWRVLRFWNNDALNNIEGVLFTIAENLTVLPPHPATRYWRSQPIAGAGVRRPFPPRMLRNTVSWSPSQPSPCKGEGTGIGG